MGYIQSAGRGIGVFGRYAANAAMFATPPLARGTANVIRGGIINPAYKTGRFLYRNPNFTSALVSGAFIGYEMSKGKDLGESLIRGVGEGIGIAASAYGASAGYAMGRSVGLGIAARVGATGAAATGIGAIAGVVPWIAGGLLAYSGVKAISNLATYKQHFSFDETFGNRRALTMRQASLMALSSQRRSSMGREAEMMHLR